MPSVSVCMPTYEPHPEHLREAIESVLAQTEQNWSLLVHDDASKTDVRAIVEPYLKDPRVTFVRSEKRLGIGGNWNACLRLTSAPAVQYLFQDDAWAPTFLAAGLAALAANPTAGMVSVCYHYQVENGPEVRAIYDRFVAEKAPYLTPGFHSGREFLREWMCRGLHPCIPGEPCFVMLRRSVMESAGTFLEDMRQMLDAEYWSRMLLYGDWVVAPGDHGFFRVHGDSTTMRNQREGVGLYDRLRCLESIRPQLPRDMRRDLNRGLSDSLAHMIRKFLNRKGQGKGVSGQGSGAVVQFALRHPLLTIKAGLSVLLTRKN